MAGYVRQSTLDIQPDKTIKAEPFNAEFNALAGAFNQTSGHSHDGTAGNGPKLDINSSTTGILPESRVSIDLTPYVKGPASSTDNTLVAFNGTTGKLVKSSGNTVTGLLSRANHTGTQAISTVSGLQSALDSKATSDQGTKADNSVSFVSQSLSETQKQQARNNIGAIDSSGAPVKSVAGKTGNVTLNADDVPTGRFKVAQVPHMQGGDVDGYVRITNTVAGDSATLGGMNLDTAGNFWYSFNGVRQFQVQTDGTVTGTNRFNTTSLRLTDTGDVSPTSTAHAFQIGPDNGDNLALDSNEILSRNNGSIVNLGLNETLNISATGLSISGTGKSVNLGGASWVDVPEPTGSKHATTKNYVDTRVMTVSQIPSIPISKVTGLQTELNLKLDKTAQAADSAKLGNETVAQWNAKIAAAGNWPGVYTGTTSGNTNFPIGHMVALFLTSSESTSVSRNQTVNNPKIASADGLGYSLGGSGSVLSGTWRSRGALSQSSANSFVLIQRVA